MEIKHIVLYRIVLYYTVPSTYKLDFVVSLKCKMVRFRVTDRINVRLKVMIRVRVRLKIFFTRLISGVYMHLYVEG